MTLQTKLPGSAIQTGTISVTAITNFSGELSASLPPDVVSSSAQVKTFLPTNTVSSSAQVTAFLPTGTVSSSGQLPSGIASSSAQVTDYLPTNVVSSSAQVTAFLPTGTVSSSTQVDVFTTTGGNTLATTGSNTFTAVQTISDTTNSTSYLDGALHVAGGMSVRKDVRVSGSLTVNGLLTAVSMSTQYVTASEYTIGTSKILLNDDDLVRFAGLSIVDSGSSSPTTASIFWDSLQHRFIYENLSGSAYNSSIIIAGPKHTGSLGDEPTLTSGYIPVATGGDHIDNSVMFQSSSNIGIGTTNPGTQLHMYTAGSGTEILVEKSSTNHLRMGVDTGNTAFVGSYNATPFQIITNGSGRIYVKTDGNVGIGTTNPIANAATTSLLHIHAASTGSEIHLTNPLTGTTGTDGGLLLQYGTKTILYNLENDVLEFGTNNTARVTITSTGNVGIGTTNPTAKLEVSGSSGLPVFISSPQNASLTIKRQTTSNKWTFTHDSNGGNVGIGANGLGIISDDANGDFGIRTTSTGNVQFYIATSGNIGIGNTSPEVKLHIFDSTARTGIDNVAFPLHIENTAAGGAYAVYTGIRFKSNYNSSPNYNFILQETTSTGGGKLHLGSYVSSAYTNQVTLVGSSGNVGIGTTNPTATLQVVGPNTTGTFIAAQNDGAGGFLGVRVNASSSPYNHFSFSNGYVGIGTTSPSTTLVVVGGAAAISTSTVSYTIAVQDPTSAAINVGGSILFQGYKTGTAAIGNYAYITGKKENGTSGNEAGYLALGTFDSGGNKAEYFRITSAGNVGIGTTSPAARFEVAGAMSANPRQFITNTDVTVGNRIGGLYFYSRDSSNSWYSGIDAFVPTGAPGVDRTDLRFYTTNVTPSERMRITTGGNVGIGTTNPDDRFQVNGGNIRVSANTTSGTFLDIVPSGTQADGIALSTSFYGGGSYGPLRINTGGSETMRITAGNRVGIGETNPGVKLHVEGVEYNRGNIVRPTVFAGDAQSSGNAIGTYVLGNGKYFNTGGGAKYVHILLPARYNQDNSRMFCVEIKGYDFDRPGILNIMVGGYVTPPNNGGPMSRVATWDATSYYSPTAYYSTNYACGVVRIYLPSTYYVSFVVNSIASGNGDTIAPDEMTMIASTSATI